MARVSTTTDETVFLFFSICYGTWQISQQISQLTTDQVTFINDSHKLLQQTVNELD